MNRAVYQGNIFLAGIYIHLLKCICCIAFLCGYEPGGHLYAGKPQRKVVADVRLIEHTASENYRNFFLEFFFIGMDDLQDVTNLFLIAAITPHGHFLPGIPQMSARFRPFNNDSIRGAVMVPFPEV